MYIVDYPDIELDSPEYKFLKDVGVREVPDLEVIINCIVIEHNQKISEENEYELPAAFCFLIKYFILHYRKSWNDKFKQTRLIPSYYKTNIINDNNRNHKANGFTLSEPNQVFIGLFFFVNTVFVHLSIR